MVTPRRGALVGSAVAIAATLVLGAALGLGGFTFVYAEGGSYLTDDPAACANCHVMREQYDGWTRSSHHAVAVCNDCHTPDAFVGKYMGKAINGWNHSFAFTTGEFAEPIRITSRNRAVTEARCRGCHEPVVFAIDGDVAAHTTAESMSCIRCHDSVGHLH